MSDEHYSVSILNKKLNEEQIRIATNHEGMLLADAGPGTGKTSTITERYVNMIIDGIDAGDILMVTFTRNSAAEMHRKITNRLTEIEAHITSDIKKMTDNRLKNEAIALRERITDAKKRVRTSTFDAYCLKIVQNAPDIISEFFEFDETLSRGAMLVENDSLNRRHFASFYADFTDTYGHLYRKKDKDIPMLIAGHVGELYDLIIRLMSFGIIPNRYDEWFFDGRQRLMGDVQEVLKRIEKVCNTSVPLDIKGDYAQSRLQQMMDKDGKREGFLITDSDMEAIADGDRSLLIYFIRHVYYEYIRRCISDNRLTFALVKILSFAILYQNDFARDANSVDYLVVDEFQDTDELQLKICLMLLNTNNLCVVGDWKQGIYGFRNATVDNILEFTKRTEAFAKELDDRVKGDFRAANCMDVKMTVNYRSTQAILSQAFLAMEAPGTSTEVFENKEGSITYLSSKNDSDSGDYPELFKKYTATEYWSSDSKSTEFSDLVDKVTEYVYSGRYKIIDPDTGETRDPRFGDIGVLFRGYSGCNGFFEEANRRKIPVFMQGDLEVLTSTPGKIALAWLRFVNDMNDRRGLSPILLYEGYTASEIKRMYKEAKGENKCVIDVIPSYIAKEREFLESRKKRPNDLLTSVFAFHKIDENAEFADIAQTIVNIVSSSYSNSLITIPDVIRLFEDAYIKEDRYTVDTVLGRNAVTVQTMHKSKGLEYPIVIVGGLNLGAMPYTGGNESIFQFDEIYGLRCKRESVTNENGVKGNVESLSYQIIHLTDEKTYYEDRRLLFVSMSRAKQYMFVASSNRKSQFFKYLSEGKDLVRPERQPVPKEDRSDFYTEAPTMDRFERRRQNLAVHDIMKYVEGDGDGLGKEHGNEVHEAAEQMAHGKKYNDKLPEMKQVAKVLDGVKDALVIETEYECALPVNQATIRGVIDLFADFGDRIEIHDYKTDTNKRNLDSYIVQLSVYGQAAMQARNVPVKCFIDFVSIPELSVEVKLLSMEEIQKKVDAYLEESAKVE